MSATTDSKPGQKSPPGPSRVPNPKKWLIEPDFIVDRDPDRCIQCRVCVQQCSNAVHEYDEETDVVRSESSTCVGCHRCASLCPTNAIRIRKSELEFRPNGNWTADVLRNVYKQAETGGVLLAGMGNDREDEVYWDHLLLNASQVTNPSIDPLREPMELTTYLGRKPNRISVEEAEDGEYSLTT
jgi:NAD-dependent dihydropyrimidine dehydrogenase PreA subunit